MALVLQKSVLRGKAETWTAENITESSLSMEEVFAGLREQIKKVLSECVQKNRILKFQFFVECKYNRLGEETILNFKTKSTLLTEESDLDKEIEAGFNKLLCERGECDIKNSSHCFEKIIKFNLKINK
jgi:hypothetical protein